MLTVFIESNQGDEETTIVQKVAVFGSGGDTFNVAEIKDVSKVGVCVSFVEGGWGAGAAAASFAPMG